MSKIVAETADLQILDSSLEVLYHERLAVYDVIASRASNQNLADDMKIAWANACLHEAKTVLMEVFGGDNVIVGEVFDLFRP